jgi:hypothetical protein
MKGTQESALPQPDRSHRLSKAAPDRGRSDTIAVDPFVILPSLCRLVHNGKAGFPEFQFPISEVKQKTRHLRGHRERTLEG